MIKQSVPEKYRREHHPARKVFQAIRIEVNDELHVFEKALEDALELLTINGRVCVITFHSLEDSICKKIMRKHSELPIEVKHLPIIPEELEPKYHYIKTIQPSKEELEEIGVINRKNMYKYTGSDIDEELECVPCCRMELDDGTVLQLSDRKFRQVLTCGLESCGYMTGKRIVKYTNNPGQAS